MEPNTDGVAFYIGGDTPHVWTDAELTASTRRYRIPIYVRSFAGVSPDLDAANCVTWLKTHKAPLGISIMLDLETLIDPSYVTAFGVNLHAAGYKVLPYGSMSTLFQNPALDGWWPADWDGVTGLDSDDPVGVVAVQYSSPNNSYDLSFVTDTVTVWDTQGAMHMPSKVVPVPVVSVACSRDPSTGQFDVCMVGNDGKVYHKWFTVANGWAGYDVLTDAV